MFVLPQVYGQNEKESMLFNAKVVDDVFEELFVRKLKSLYCPNSENWIFRYAKRTFIFLEWFLLWRQMQTKIMLMLNDACRLELQQKPKPYIDVLIFISHVLSRSTVCQMNSQSTEKSQVFHFYSPIPL